MLEVIALSLALAMDATAVAAARGLAARRHEAVILPVIFGGFQSGMAALGWGLGRWGGDHIAAAYPWIGFGLLFAIGAKMLTDSLRSKSTAGNPGASGQPVEDRTGAWVYIGLAVATSIDAAAAGFTLPLLALDPWLTVVLIGAITAACVTLGYAIGQTAGRHLGGRLAIVGALVVMGVGVHVLVQQL